MLVEVFEPSTTHFISRGKKYADAFENFRYNYTKFRIRDSNNMAFCFYDHKQDLAIQQETEKVELNSFSGRVRFYKQNGRFVWKLKMR